MDINKIETELEALPGQIREQELSVVELEKKLKESKLELDVAIGMTVLTSKAPNATEKKAKATVETQLDLKKVIEAEYNLKKTEAEFNFLTNRFTALRKIGSLEQEMMRSQLGGQ